MVGLICILLAFILLNGLVATRTPGVYVDEPQLVDPAANLYLGAGFTSTLWSQPRAAFWSGYVPLYPGILALGFKVMGFGLFQTRFVNTLLVAAGACVIWLGLRRSHLVREPLNRLLCVALVLSGSVSTLTFRTIRPDATMFAVCTLVFFACCLPSKFYVRYLLIGLAAALLPASGISVAVYVGTLLGLNLLVYRFANLRLLLAVGIGMVAGVAALRLFYGHFSAWQAFIQGMVPETSLSANVPGGTSFVRTKILGESWGSPNMFTCFFGNPLDLESKASMFDYSAALLFAAVLLLAFTEWRPLSSDSRKFIIFVVAITLAVPPVMHLAGHYPSYYRWMTYIPLAIALPKLLEIHREAGGRAFPRRAVLAVAAFSLCLGIPLRTVAVIPSWRNRSVAPLEQVAAQIVRPTDVVIGDFRAYFALRPRCQLLYAYGLNSCGEFRLIPDLPTNQISLLCLHPEDVAAVTNRIGGSWKKIPLDAIPAASTLAQTRYAEDFYRRDTRP